MPSYLANQIIQNRLDYKEVVTRYPQFKEDMDALLIERGHGHLIVE